MTAATTNGAAERRWRHLAISETIHISALGVWCGAVVMTGAMAAVTFPTMKRLDPSLPAYEAYPGDHWSLAAGKVMAQVFTIADLVQFIAAALAGATLLAAIGFFGMSLRRPVNALRVILFTVGVGILAYQLFSLAPRMNEAMIGYWGQAEAGDVDAADAFKRRFDALHPQASTALSALAALTLASTALAAWSASSRRPGEGPGAAGGRTGTSDHPPPVGERRVEEPALARGGP